MNPKVALKHLKTSFPSIIYPFALFIWGVSLLKPNIRKKGTLITRGFLGNLKTTNRGYREPRMTKKHLNQQQADHPKAQNP